MENQNQKQVSEELSPDDKSEDSVLKDIDNVKGFLNKIKGRVISTTAPVAKKVPKVTARAQKIKTKGKKMKIGIGVVVLSVFLLLISRLTSSINKPTDSVVVKPPEFEVNIPTIPPFRSSNPSIYANDLDVLKIEEDINVLENEMLTTPLRESTLLPPNLEFKINFN